MEEARDTVIMPNLDRFGDLNSVEIYFEQISKFPLLDKEEEIELVRAYKQDLPDPDKTSPEEYQRIEDEIRQARERMINSNLRLVVSIAKNYMGRGLDLLDLIQEGNSGLMRAVDKFDPDKGFKFSTYATWWIKRGVSRALDEKSSNLVVKVPVNRKARIDRVRAIQSELADNTVGRSPTLEELANAAFLPKDQVAADLEVSYRFSNSVSPETPIGRDGGNLVLRDVVEDKSQHDPAEEVALSVMSEQLYSMMEEVLDEREIQIIADRYEIGNSEKLTLAALGKKLGITRERVRQIEESALIKLRNEMDMMRLHESDLL